MNKIAQNSFLYLSAKILSLVFSFFSAILLGRYLGVENYGIYGFAVSIGSILVVFLHMGARNYITREIIKREKNIDEFIANLFGLRFIILFILELFLLLYIYINHFDRTMNLVLLIIVNTVFFNSFLSIFFALNRAKEYYIVEICNQIIAGFLTVSGYYLILTNKGQIKSIVFWLMFLSLFQNFVIGKITFKIHKKSFFKILKAVKIIKIRDIFIQSLPFLLTSILVVILFRIDSVMLKYFTSVKRVGLYLSGYKFIELCTYFPDAFIYILFPFFVKKYIKDSGKLFFYYKKIIKLILLLIIPIVLGFYFYSSQIIKLVWGDKFLEAGRTLKILGFAPFFIFLSFLNANILVALNKEKLLFKIMLLSTVFNIASNLYFIPRYQEIGAAITTVASEGLFFILNLSLIIKFFSYKIMRAFDGMKIIFLAAVFLAIIYYFSIDNIFLAGLIYGVVYFFLLFLIKPITKKDLQSFKKA